ncbi:hypothetical protein GCM10009663_59190 [Kitasatospora arboriphila]|uniref:Uncharacterized protein n=1 Tax=Kitasatospora arboriphila TaxID=258052 RepID=A0ABN1TZH7_9ACTN
MTLVESSPCQQGSADPPRRVARLHHPERPDRHTEVSIKADQAQGMTEQASRRPSETFNLSTA